ncbi:SH3 domain-containing protein [Marivita sp. GX14005]|uniref:SH3 domain-containing protein n=1 Tax=Marivita sp. GX14005 TaxID=2942276 RepID=UPI00201A14DB|nr:SH3 domain-containing protein [Marivita sp. GX14005]MCL3882131.1 SH3 domain-containing protein [Marivita sp. GX14005]
MNRYIIIAFAVMALAFYELSGGADFVPGENSLRIFAQPKPVAPRSQSADLVARADTSASRLTDVVPARAAPEPETSLDPVLSGVSLASVEQMASAAEDTATIATPVPPKPEIQSGPDLRFVDGDRVNMRAGPGTDFAVIGQLQRNDMIEVIDDEGDGWLHIRASASGEDGWMADWLVSAAN